MLQNSPRVCCLVLHSEAWCSFFSHSLYQTSSFTIPPVIMSCWTLAALQGHRSHFQILKIIRSSLHSHLFFSRLSSCQWSKQQRKKKSTIFFLLSCLSALTCAPWPPSLFFSRTVPSWCALRRFWSQQVRWSPSPWRPGTCPSLSLASGATSASSTSRVSATAWRPSASTAPACSARTAR